MQRIGRINPFAILQRLFPPYLIRPQRLRPAFIQIRRPSDLRLITHHLDIRLEYRCHIRRIGTRDILLPHFRRLRTLRLTACRIADRFVIQFFTPSIFLQPHIRYRLRSRYRHPGRVRFISRYPLDLIHPDAILTITSIPILIVLPTEDVLARCRNFSLKTFPSIIRRSITSCYFNSGKTFYFPLNLLVLFPSMLSGVT